MRDYAASVSTIKQSTHYGRMPRFEDEIPLGSILSSLHRDTILLAFLYLSNHPRTHE